MPANENPHSQYIMGYNGRHLIACMHASGCHPHNIRDLAAVTPGQQMLLVSGSQQAGPLTLADENWPYQQLTGLSLAQ